MATGQKSFSTSGKKYEVTTFEPLPVKDWQGRLDCSKVEIRKSANPGSAPRVSLRLEALDSKLPNGTKNRIVFLDLHCSLKPGKDGKVMPERQNQLLGLARALGVEADIPTTTMTDDEGNSVECLDPQALMTWVKQFHGAVVGFRSNREKDQNGNLQSRVDYFHAKPKQAPAPAPVAGLDDDAPEFEDPDEPAEEPAPKKNGKKK